MGKAERKPRDFKAEYAARRARDLAAGTTPRKRRDAQARAAGKPRDHELERERSLIRAKARGFKSLADQRKAGGATANAYLFYRGRALSKHGMTDESYERVRAENRAWSAENGEIRWRIVNTYDARIDEREDDWSDERIGYIASYHAANVNPKSNYESMLNDKGGRTTWAVGKDANKLRSNAAQYMYLVDTMGIFSPDEFETRYGSIPRQAAKLFNDGIPVP